MSDSYPAVDKCESCGATRWLVPVRTPNLQDVETVRWICPTCLAKEAHVDWTATPERAEWEGARNMDEQERAMATARVHHPSVKAMIDPHTQEVDTCDSCGEVRWCVPVRTLATFRWLCPPCMTKERGADWTAERLHREWREGSDSPAPPEPKKPYTPPELVRLHLEERVLAYAANWQKVVKYLNSDEYRSNPNGWTREDMNRIWNLIVQLNEGVKT